MDAVKGEVRKAAAAPADGVRRRPLVPSEKGNAAASAGRRREAAFRFKPVALPSALAARRCTSPSPGRASAVDGSAPCNRAQSADRERPAASSAAPSSRLKPSTIAAASSVTPARNAAAEAHITPPRATSAKAPDGFWASVRSSSPSLRSESVPAPAKKIDRLARGLPSEMAKVKVQAGAAAERKRSPLRGNTNNIGDQCENARPSEAPSKRVVEQHRWPAMMTGWGSAGSLTLGSITQAADKASIASSSSNPSGRSPKRVHPSEGTGKCLNRPSNERAKRAAIHRSRREDKTDSGSDASSQTSESSKSACRPSRAISSPVPILHRSSSPSKVSSAASSTSGSYQSPSRMRPSAPCRSKCASATQSCAAQPVFNYIVDTRKGKKNAGQIENIHQLRLLHNTYLQWRFVNAHSEATPSFRENSVESILYSVWKSIVTLRDALTVTRIDVRLLQQELKLYYILTEQITYLEQWPVLEEENSSTLVEVIEALKASTMRLPVTSRAQVDAVAVKNAISSAVDVMQALSSSICYLQSKVEDRTSLVSELSVMARQEKLALDECRELLASAAKMQEASLRTHLMQLREGVAG
ncbi:AUGMIN subunit 8-like isoform X2 [Phragmites australis]|uniref:AUGMIN subunit 8-like isoform X2 n=1 Tax=Phragmites australis TaxID=29695 RepID=UPI002D79BDDE|nr:AUGMIN subunit 8-like isoform X2 [Phragmites australis]